eukprot:gb/GECG01003234.1/.p1 GENE.gb/GECG01003234.1/~~gb/GECG01003234.1/.p1  ORF type:complete len:444 (+),score=37.44 gb/GECG01003234.1/:1-1332(+)
MSLSETPFLDFLARFDATSIFEVVHGGNLEWWYRELERRYDSERREGYRRAIGINMLVLILEGRMYGELINRRELLYLLLELSDTQFKYLEHWYQTPPREWRPAGRNDDPIVSFVRHVFHIQILPLQDVLRLCSWHREEDTETQLRRLGDRLDNPWKSAMIKWAKDNPVEYTTSGKVTVLIRKATDFRNPVYSKYFREGVFDKVFLRFRGTECSCCGQQCWRDWQTNLRFRLKQAYVRNETGSVVRITAHAGYIERFREEWEEISSILRKQFGSDWKKKANLSEQRADKLKVRGIQFVCIGHSLGGALAQLCGSQLQTETKTTPIVFTLNSPRLFDSATVRYLRRVRVFTHYRCYHKRDCIKECPCQCCCYEHYADREIPLGHSPDASCIALHKRKLNAERVRNAFEELEELLSGPPQDERSRIDFIDDVTKKIEELSKAIES